MTLPEKKGESYVLTYNDYEDEAGNARKGVKKTLEVDVVIGADGANSRVAKDIEAGDYEYAIAFQDWDNSKRWQGIIEKRQETLFCRRLPCFEGIWTWKQRGRGQSMPMIWSRYPVSTLIE